MSHNYNTRPTNRVDRKVYFETKRITQQNQNNQASPNNHLTMSNNNSPPHRSQPSPTQQQEAKHQQQVSDNPNMMEQLLLRMQALEHELKQQRPRSTTSADSSSPSTSPTTRTSVSAIPNAIGSTLGTAAAPTNATSDTKSQQQGNSSIPPQSQLPSHNNQRQQQQVILVNDDNQEQDEQQREEFHTQQEEYDNKDGIILQDDFGSPTGQFIDDETRIQFRRRYPIAKPIFKPYYHDATGRLNTIRSRVIRNHIVRSIPALQARISRGANISAFALQTGMANEQLITDLAMCFSDCFAECLLMQKNLIKDLMGMQRILKTTEHHLFEQDEKDIPIIRARGRGNFRTRSSRGGFRGRSRGRFQSRLGYNNYNNYSNYNNSSNFASSQTSTSSATTPQVFHAKSKTQGQH